MSFQASSINQSDSTGDKFNETSHVLIDARFCLRTLREQHKFYNIYDAIDIKNSKWINLYAKPNNGKQTFSNRTKENQKNQLSPKVIWTGNATLGKGSYNLEAHQRYGPSLRTMFEHLKTPPHQKDLLHLLLQMLQLIEKMSKNKLVSGELTPDLLVFDANPKKSELYLLNCFSLIKRGETAKVKHTKYCSRGMHLGRNIDVKDDLESACYILIDIFTEGNFLQDKSASEYLEVKLSENINEFGHNLPKALLDFYNYVISLNYKDEINFFHWKTYLTRLLTPEFLAQPYGFKLAKVEKAKPSVEPVSKGELSEGKYQAEIDEDLQQQDREEKKIKLGRVMMKSENRQLVADH